MLLLDFFKKQHECQHSKVTADKDIAYCPDCGELIENEWFITRCACCGVKLRAIKKNGEIMPDEKFCHNCGVKEFIVEKLPKINFIDINYAVIVKSVLKCDVRSFTQVWEAKESFPEMKLLPGAISKISF